MTWSEFVSDVENVTLKIDKLVEMGLPVAELFSPTQAKSAEDLAAKVLPQIDQAIAAHQAGGATQQTAVTALATIASTVAQSGLLPADTSQQITTAAAVATGLPEGTFTG
ncbi:MAG: hypothetical protein ABSA86_11465 [Oryzomonas sp.]|jgi:hypothetical protein